ncbi:MAG: hypothetical protein KDN22_18130 [Verrucomicrobiae bacterium]|nr:hypothetical protein [Verrucomicrobiae bacterium]
MARLFALAICPGVLVAQETETKKSDGPVADYSQAFAKLRALGLPDVSDTEYISSGRSGELFGYQLQIAGGYWVANKESADGSRAAFMPLRRPSSIITREVYSANLAQLKDEFGEDSPAYVEFNARQYGEFAVVEEVVPADLDADIKLVQDHLAKGEESGVDYLAANFLAFAAFVDSAGKQTEANQIAATVLSSVRDPEQALKQLTVKIGTLEMEAITERFHESMDYLKLSEEMTACAAKYEGAWIHSVGMLQAAEKINAYAASYPPIVPENLESLPEEGKAFIAMLPEFGKDEFNSVRGNSGEFWLLSNTGAGESESKGSLAGLLSLGPKAIPVLTSILNSESPLPIIDAEAGYGRSDPFSYRDEDLDPEDLDDELLQALASRYLPMTVSALARTILRPILPKDGDSFDEYGEEEEVDLDQLKQRATKLYESIKDLSGVPLAVYFLESDASTKSQSNAALQFLLEHGGENEIALIEKKLLDFDALSETAQQVGTYVRKREGAAKEFLEKYIIKAKEVFEQESKLDGGGSASAGQLESFFNQLRELVLARGVPEILEQLVSGEKQYQDVQAALSLGLAKLADAEARTLLLDAAVKVESPDTALRLVSIIGQLDQLRMRLASEPGAQVPVPDNEETPRTIQAHRNQWGAILDRDEPINVQLGDPFALRLNEVVGFQVEQLFGGGRGLTPDVYRNFRSYQGLFLQRAKERLDGKSEDELTPIPEVAGLTEEEGRKVIASLTSASTDPEAFGAVVTALTRDQMAYLSAQEVTEQGLIDALKNLAHRVVKDRVPDTVKVRIKPLGELVSRKDFSASMADDALVDRMVDVLIQDFEQTKQPLAIQIFRQPDFAGIGIGSAFPDEDAIGTLRQQLAWQLDLRGDAAAKDHVVVMVSGDSNRVNAAWPLTSDPPVEGAPEEIVEETEDDDRLEKELNYSFGGGRDHVVLQMQLKEGLRQAFTEGNQLGSQLTITFVTLPGIVPKSKQKEDSTAE